MSLTHSGLNRSVASPHGAADPFAMQLALSRVHARLVPMLKRERGYAVDPSAEQWFELPAGRGFAGYGLGRALRMLLDVLRGLTALHDTFDARGNTFAHGDVALPQFRIDGDGVCRLVPLTARHSLAAEGVFALEVLGHLAPERLLGEKVDARADVFSAGVLLWEALAGRRLFEESTGDAIIDRLLGEKLQMPQLPPELAWAIPLKAVAARALAVDPHQRFADCAELSTAIAIVARDRIASHVEIANFFGSKAPSVSQQLVPSRSSTFPAVATRPASQSGSTLAALGPARGVSRKSPFADLLSAEPRPASGERVAVSLPEPVEHASPREPVEHAADSSGERLSSKPPPPLSAWAQLPSLPAALPIANKATRAAIVAPLSTLETDDLTLAAAAFRGGSTRRWWRVLALLSLGIAAAMAWVMYRDARRGYEVTPSHATSKPERSPAAAPDEPGEPRSPDPGAPNAVPAPKNAASTPRALTPRAPKVRFKAASPGEKDYGI